MGTNCAPPLADIFLYSYEAEFIQSLLSTVKKKKESQFNFTYRYIDTSMTYCQSNTQILRIIWVRWIPLGLRSIKRRRATPLLPTWIYSCRSRGTVSYALPCTTNVTILTSISQTFRSWVAIFHLRQPIVFLSHSSYGMPGLASLMNVLFKGWRDFHLSSSDRDMPFNVWNRPSGSVMVNIGISANIITWYSGTWPYTMTPSIDQTLHQFANNYRTGSYYRFWLYYQISEVSIEHFNGCG